MRGTAQHRHRSFVPSSFVILYIFITALHHRRAHADAYSLSLSLSLSLCLFPWNGALFCCRYFSRLSVSTSTDTNQWLSSINVRPPAMRPARIY